jgi:hypothetical protein
METVYVVSLWPITDFNFIQPNGNQTAFVESLEAGTADVTRLSLSLIAACSVLLSVTLNAFGVMKGINESCNNNNIHQLFPNAHLIQIIQAFVPFIKIPLNWAWYAFVAQLAGPLLVSNLAEKMVFYITVLAFCSVRVAKQYMFSSDP